MIQRLLPRPALLLLLPVLLGAFTRPAFAQTAPPAPNPARQKPLFDGRTLNGWEGDPKLWRVEDGAIVGGSLTETIRQNEFLATTARYTNFILRLRFRLQGGSGFINSGVQMRSERVPNSSEMAGYQCDIGDPNWWGSLYDESRRNRVLAWSDLAAIEPTLQRNGWNDYVIRADGRRITTWINGKLGVDYLEPDPDIIGSGRIGFQVHGGGAAQASFREIIIEELPPTPPVPGAAVPPAPRGESPLSPEDQQATFSVPPGFVVELVAAEPDGGKFVAIDFDHAGRMWTMTALEYPLDANEAGAEARALFERGGRDRVLVFDTPTRPGRQTARTFAEGLVMPLGILPVRDGTYVQYGDAIRHYTDTNRDGRADGYTNVLTGFGIEDSHLFPHQFTRAPGGWFWLAQGAFNSSKVRSSAGEVTDFNKTKLARWRPDGSQFEVIGWGPCNIWGLVIDRHGEVFIQEANDQGWPMMPFLEGASYPLCGDDVPRPYAPPFPKTGEKEMGGTGLSGLAFSEGGNSFPAPWRDVFFINNPITRKVQAIRVHRGAPGATEPGNGWQLEHLPDFVLSSDPWFRPVAMTFGPDGCLYVVDWYNKIISHNEVPRKHPERDKTRGRVWRIRHESQPHRLEVPNLYTAPESALLASLQAPSTWEVNAAWQEIVDRQAVGLAPDLARLLAEEGQPADVRIRALWCLEGLGRLNLSQVEAALAARPRALRREALRAAAGSPLAGATPASLLALGRRGLGDPDRLVHQEALRLLGRLPARAGVDGPTLTEVLGLLAEAGATARPGDWAKAPGFFAAFERYLIRLTFERHPQEVARFLDARPTVGSTEARAFACVALGGNEGARRFAALAPSLGRAPSGDEILLLAAVPDLPAAREGLEKLLADPANLRLLFDQRSRLPATAGLAPLLTQAVRALVARDPSAANQALLVQLATGFKLAGLEAELVTAATQPGARPEAQLAALRALRESGSTRVDVLRRFATSGHEGVRREAITALAAARSDEAVTALLELWPGLSSAVRRTVVDRLAGSPATARRLVAAVKGGDIRRDELDGYALDKLGRVLPDDPEVKALVNELGSTLRPVLRLDGGDGDWIDTELTLDGPFTLEAWVKLDAGIGNQDSLLGSPAGLDANFYDSRFRLWVAGLNDVVVATRPMAPGAWTHAALTRDAGGVFRLYLNGELDATSSARDTRRFEKVTPFRSNVPGGTAGEIAEYRVWKTCRTADELRASANLALSPTHPAAAALLFHGTGTQWGKLAGGARLERTADLPPVQTEAEAAAWRERFDRFRALAAQPADAARGREVFVQTCAPCHAVRGAGGRIGPALDGAGAHGLEALLRNILTPNAAMEAGYRRYQVETRDGEVVEGLLVSEDADFITLRQPNTEDLRLPRPQTRRSGFVRGSVMPEGLLESLAPADATHLLGYLLTLK